MSIDFKDVTKGFVTKDGPLTAVEDVNLTIEDGNIFGIVGYSGAGKSTLVRMLNGLETPSSGEIDINGAKIASLTGKALRKQRQKIGMIFQHFNLLWSRTVIQNVMFPLEIAGVGKAERQAKAEELVKLVGLEGREHAYPSELSGGQKQRVGIARALANDPDIIISDEATSALDPQTTDEVLDLLLDINHRLGVSILLITHEMHAVRKICDHVAVMDAGKVVEKGTVLEVFNNPQQAITKRFVSQEVLPKTEGTELTLEELISAYPDGVLLQLSFKGNQIQQPVTSEVLRQYPHLQLNIIEASIHTTKEASLGTLLLHVVGSAEDIAGALETIRQADVESEVIHRE